MSTSVSERTVGPRRVGNGRSWKILGILLCFQVTGLAAFYYYRYPLKFPAVDILSAYGYWALVVGTILTTTALVYVHRSPLVGFVSTLMFYVVLYSPSVLFYSVPGGDTNGEIIDLTLMSRFTRLSPTQSGQFGYLEWPMNYLYALVLKRVYELGDIISTVDVGFAIYSLLLLIAVFLFAYRIGDSFTAYLASVSYFVLSFPILNSQFVPQFLALVFLFFLFITMDREGVGWRVLEFTLFIVLVFTHPVFPVFYPIALALRPGIASVFTQIEDDTEFRTVSEALRHPISLLRRSASPETWLPNGYEMYFRIFATFTIYVIVNTPSRLVSWLLLTDTEAGGHPVVRVVTGLLPISTSGTSTGGGEVRLLYELVPQWVDLVVSTGSRIVVISLFVVLVVSFLFTDSGNDQSANTFSVADYGVEIVVTCLVLFLVTSVISAAYGIRVFQVALLPVAVFFYGMQKYKRVAIVLIVCLAVMSPVLVANSYTDSALTGGGNTIGYQETQAGQVVDDHYGYNGTNTTDVIVPPRTPYPVGPLDGRRSIDVRFYLLFPEADVPASGPVVHSDRLVKYLEHRGYDCQLGTEENTVVYDNGAEVVWGANDDGLRECLRTDPGQ